MCCVVWVGEHGCVHARVLVQVLFCASETVSCISR